MPEKLSRLDKLARSQIMTNTFIKIATFFVLYVYTCMWSQKVTSLKEAFKALNQGVFILPFGASLSSRFVHVIDKKAANRVHEKI